MVWQATLVEKIFDTPRNNPHGFWAPEGCYLDAQQRLWVADRNNGRVVGLKAGEADVVVSTNGGPGSVAHEDGILFVIYSGTHSGEIHNLNPGRSPVQNLKYMAGVAIAGAKRYVLSDSLYEPSSGCVCDVLPHGSEFRFSTPLVGFGELAFEGPDFKQKARKILKFSAQEDGLYLLAQMDAREYKTYNVGNDDTRVFSYDFGTRKLASLMNIEGRGSDIADMCADKQHLFFLYQCNEPSIEVVNPKDQRTLEVPEKVVFSGIDPFKAGAHPSSMSVRTYGDRTLMALVTEYSIGLYELKQK